MVAEKRTDVVEGDRWDVNSLYLSLEAWEADFKRLADDKAFAEIASYRTQLGKGAKTLASLLKVFFNLEQKLAKLYTYAQLRCDEDLTAQTFKAAYDRALLLLSDFEVKTAWIQPEILQLPEESIKSYLKEEILADFRSVLKRFLAVKSYTLPAEQEQLLARASRPLQAISKAFSIFNNADLQFSPIRNREGEEKPLTHASYGRYLESKDRTLREGAFKGMHRRYGEFGNTLAELLSGQVQRLLFEVKARNYPSCLDAALIPYQIDVDVYHNLVQTVRSHLPLLHRYMELRRKVLGVKTLHSWDLHVPLVSATEHTYSFQESVQMTLEAVAPLGEEYQQVLRRGLIEERWVDRYENLGKRSGAYSGGCYDSHPFILLNYEGTFRDVMTLAHEAGHSMHSFFSRRDQTYQNADYPIFVAEVASTFNEELLFRHLLTQASSDVEKGYLLNRRLDDIRATLFRQTQFAEFELCLHTLAEKGAALTTSVLQEEYAQLNADYYGLALERDVEVAVECLRIPHFYSNFYVYQYATGISAAYALCEQVLNGGEKACKDYLRFLSSGASRYPLELLELAGVDMRRPDPVEKLLKQFKLLLDQFEEVLGRIESH